MKKKGKGLFSKIKRDLGVFLSSEEGKILEKNVIETAAVLGIMGAGVMISEAQSNPTHTNYLHNQGAAGQVRGRHVSHSSSPVHSEGPPPPDEEPCMNHDSCMCGPDGTVITLPPTVCEDPVGHVNTCTDIDCSLPCQGQHDNWICDDGTERHSQSDCTQIPGHVNNVDDLCQHDNWSCDSDGERTIHNEYCIDCPPSHIDNENESCPVHSNGGHTDGITPLPCFVHHDRYGCACVEPRFHQSYDVPDQTCSLPEHNNVVGVGPCELPVDDPCHPDHINNGL